MTRTDTVEVLTDHSFRDPALLTLALTHPSYSYEADNTRGNERLEFLGDAVLDLVVAEVLFANHPDWDEGLLTRVRSSLVNTRALAERARAIGLGEALLLGRTELRAGGAEKDSILACALEAVIGALYLDGGLAPAKTWITRLFAEALAAAEAPPADPKTRFQEWAHATLRETPTYTLLADTGAENAEDRFHVEVRVAGESHGTARGRTKRAAERAAALVALETVQEASE